MWTGSTERIIMIWGNIDTEDVEALTSRGYQVIRMTPGVSEQAELLRTIVTAHV